MDPRIVLCEACGSEGKIYHYDGPDAEFIEDCPYCEGTGGEIIETQTLDYPEDFDAYHGAATLHAINGEQK